MNLCDEVPMDAKTRLYLQSVMQSGQSGRPYCNLEVPSRKKPICPSAISTSLFTVNHDDLREINVTYLFTNSHCPELCQCYITQGDSQLFCEYRFLYDAVVA